MVLSVLVLASVAVVGTLVVLRTVGDQHGPTAISPSARATSLDAVSIATAAGARLDVPAGAIPPAASGGPGAMDITISSAADAPAPDPGSLPDGLRVDTQAALRLEPSGQTFSQPVTISVPLPPGTDPDTVGGLARYEPTTGAWETFPSYLDTDSGELRAEVWSFSLWAPWYDERPNRRRWQEENGGWIVITNVRVGPEGWYGFPYRFFGTPPPRSMITGTTYGVGVVGYELANPALIEYLQLHIRDEAGNWVSETRRDLNIPLTVWASPRTGRADAGVPGGTREIWLPAGTYLLAETWTGSEINRTNPRYQPLVGSAHRPLGELVIEPGDRYGFVEEVRLADGLSADDGWLIGRAPFLGEEMPAPLEFDPYAEEHDGDDPVAHCAQNPFAEGCEIDLGDGPGAGSATPLDRAPPSNQPDTRAFCAALVAVPEAEGMIDDPAIEGDAAAMRAAFGRFVTLFEEVVRTAPVDLVDDARTILELLVGLEAELERQGAWGWSLSEQDRVIDAYLDRGGQDRLDRAFDNLGARIPELCGGAAAGGTVGDDSDATAGGSSPVEPEVDPRGREGGWCISGGRQYDATHERCHSYIAADGSCMTCDPDDRDSCERTGLFVGRSAGCDPDR